MKKLIFVETKHFSTSKEVFKFLENKLQYSFFVFQNKTYAINQADFGVADYGLSRKDYTQYKAPIIEKIKQKILVFKG